MIYFKLGRFRNRDYLTQISSYLLVTSLFFFTYPGYIEELKKVKKDYLSMKQNH